MSIETVEDCASNWGVFEVPSESQPDVTYTVRLHGSEGPAFCSCPAYMYFKGEEWDRTCKHIAKIWDEEEGACLYNMQWRPATTSPAMRPARYTIPDSDFSGSTCRCGGPMVCVKRAV